MTFEEAKELLKNLRKQKKKIDVLKLRYEHCLSDASILSDNVAVTERAEKASEEFEKSFLEYMAIEDRIAAALDSLTDEEKVIIIDIYMNGIPEWQAAQKLYYSRETIARRKRTAIEKISQGL